MIWTYDLANRVLTETNGLSQTTTYTYDNAGRRLTKLDGNLQTTTYGYNDNGRRTSETFSDGTKNEWGFDSRGFRNLEKSPTHERQLQYDELGRLKQVDDVTLGRTIVYGHDAVGNVTTKTEGGVTQRFTYDARNMLVAAQEGSSPPVQLKYDALGRRTAIIRPNGVRTDFDFDDVSQVKSITHSKGGVALLGFSYLHDGDGMRTRKTREDGSYEAYGFDSSRRLTNVNYSSGRAITYQLDAWGNWGNTFDSARPTSAPGQTWTYRTNAFNQLFRIEGFFGVISDFTHDANGNQLTEVAGPAGAGGTTTYAWTRGNRLSSVTKPSGVTSYSYDANGLRTRRVDASGTINYLLDGASVLAELDGAGTITTRYLNNPQAIDDVFAHTTPSGTYWPLTDALGSVVALTDISGALVRRYDYEVYGKRSDLGGAGPTTDRGFTSRWADANGVQENRDRPRDPKLGGWLRADRAKFVDGPNLYSYGAANPVMNTDPEGRWVKVEPGSTLFHSPSASGLRPETFINFAVRQLRSTATGIRLLTRVGYAGNVLIQEGDLSSRPAKGLTHGPDVSDIPCPYVIDVQVYVTLDPVAFARDDRFVIGQGDPRQTPAGLLAHELGHAEAALILMQVFPDFRLRRSYFEWGPQRSNTFQENAAKYAAMMACVVADEVESELEPIAAIPPCSHSLELGPNP